MKGHLTQALRSNRGQGLKSWASIMGSSIVLVAGEASGDLYGADLALALRQRYPKRALYGVGSSRMQAAGVHLWMNSRFWGAIGVTEAIKVAPRLLLAFQQLKAHLKRNPPDLMIPIDFGAFNVPLSRWAKQHGIKVFYYMPPGSWRRDHQGSDLPRVTDCIATPFEWSAELLKQQGANAHWVGHPLLELVRPTEPKAAFCERLGLDEERPILGFLPGSRVHEVYNLIPAFANVANVLHHTRPGLQFVISLMPHFALKRIQSLWYRFSRLFVSWETHSVYNLMHHADLLITCSGTATLEAAIAGAPMLIVYRGSPLMNLEYRLRRKKLGISYIGLPNLILKRQICPEFIQEEVTSPSLVHHALRLLSQGEEYQQQKAGFKELRCLLGEGNTRWKVVELISQFL